jgi:hypothetical protein
MLFIYSILFRLCKGGWDFKIGLFKFLTFWWLLNLSMPPVQPKISRLIHIIEVCVVYNSVIIYMYFKISLKMMNGVVQTERWTSLFEIFSGLRISQRVRLLFLAWLFEKNWGYPAPKSPCVGVSEHFTTVCHSPLKVTVISSGIIIKLVGNFSRP